MSDFEKWWNSVRDEVLYPERHRPEFEDAYEAGMIKGLEKAHLITTKQIAMQSESPCSDICAELEAAIRDTKNKQTI